MTRPVGVGARTQRFGGVAMLLALAVLPLLAALLPVAPVEARRATVPQWGTGRYSDGDRLIFDPPFAVAPVIVTSAVRTDRAVASAAIRSDETGFVLSLVDEQGDPVSNALVSWIAVLPDATRYIDGGTATPGEDGYVRLARSFPRAPIIVTNAVRDGIAIASGTYAALPDQGFRVTTDTGRRGFTSGTSVTWLAVLPSALNGFVGQQADLADGEPVAFPAPFAGNGVVVVGSAAGQPFGALDVSAAGFTASLGAVADDTGTGPTAWLAYNGPSTAPAPPVQYATGTIVVVGIWGEGAHAVPPVSACYTVSSDPGGTSLLAGACATGSPTVLQLAGLGLPFVPGQTYWVRELPVTGYDLFSVNPAPVVIPAATGTATVFFRHHTQPAHAAVEQGELIVVTTYAQGTAPLAQTCAAISTRPSGEGLIGRVCGTGSIAVASTAAYGLPIPTGATLYVRNETPSGWTSYGGDTAAVAIPYPGVAAVSFVNVPAPACVPAQGVVCP